MGKFRTVFLLFLLFVFSPLFSQKKDTPRNGEGVHSFLSRNNYSPQKYADEFLHLNKDKLGKNNSLLLGVSYVLPEIKNKGNERTEANNRKIGGKYKEPLFGKEHQEYTIKSLDLQGACYFLVSGHGGPDCGAITKVDGRELHEDEYAYDIMLRLSKNLLEHGATVHIIIQDKNDGIRNGMYLNNNKSETCMGEAIPLNQAARLRQRSNKINQLSKNAKEKFQRAVFIHLDSRGHRNQLDVFFYHKNGDTRGEKFAKTISDTFEAQYKKFQPGRGFTGTVSSRNLYVLNNTQPTSIFVELANMQNVFDQRRYVQENNRQALANWLLRGFIEELRTEKR